MSRWHRYAYLAVLPSGCMFLVFTDSSGFVVFRDYLLGVGRSGCRVFLALVMLSLTLVARCSICVVYWGFWSIGLAAQQRSCRPDQAACVPRYWMDAKCGALALKEKVRVASGAGKFSAQSLFLFLVAPLYSVCATRSEVASHAFTCSSRLVAHWHC